MNALNSKMCRCYGTAAPMRAVDSPNTLPVLATGIPIHQIKLNVWLSISNLIRRAR